MHRTVKRVASAIGVAVLIMVSVVLPASAASPTPTATAVPVQKSAVTPLAAVPQADGRFGIVQATEQLDRAVQAGTKWERLVFEWSAYQPNGPQDW